MKSTLCSLWIAARTTCAFVLTMMSFALLPAVAKAQTSFVTSVNLVDGNLRNNVDISLGYEFTVGAAPITVTEVGRWVVAGNANAHTVKLVLASTGADVSGASAQVVTAGATAGEFKYAPLAAPVALEANTAYYIVSQETEAGDQWYNDGVQIAHTDVATIEHAIWRTESTWNPGGTPDYGYGPLNFKYATGMEGDVAVTGVSVAPTSAVLEVGATQLLTAMVSPADATNSTVSWSSSNTAVATVDGLGIVTAIAEGEAVITVITEDGDFTATCSIAVTGAPASVTVPAANTYAIRKAAATGVMAIDINSEHPGGFYQSFLRDFRSGLFVFQMPVLDRPITSVTFNAYHKDNVVTNYSVSLFGHDSIPNLSTIPSSLAAYWGYGLPANQPGIELVPNLVGAGSTQNALGWVTTDVTSFVRDQYVSGRYLILRVGSTFDAPTDAANESLHPTGRIYFDGGPGAITRNQVPYLTIITAGDIVDVTGVSVLPATISLPMGTSQQLVATVTPGDASYRAVTWSSNNPSVATVSSSGLVTGIAAGNATITVTANGGHTATANVTVALADVAVSGVSVSPVGATRRAGTAQQLTATVLPTNATNQTVSWHSSDTSVATVSNSGLVAALSAGNATITVTTAEGGFTATSALTVTPAPVAVSYPMDAGGWSSATPSADSRIIYVSANGNDGTAQTYSPAQVGADPASPSIAVNAFKTLAAARNQMRAGFPDWILFRRGDTFTDVANLGGNSIGGRNGAERWVFSHYGSSGDRPLLTGAYWSCVGESGNIAVIGLDIYYRTRDPKSPFWVGFSEQNRIIFTAIGPILGNILLEDSVFRNASDNISMDMDSAVNIEIRRCAIWEGYKGTTTETGTAGANADRSQGIYVDGASGLRIEECFFDHNGWVTDASGNLVGYGRSIYSHNVYLANGSNNTTVVGNIIARGAANGLQARAGNYIEDNLFMLNAIGGFSAAYPGEPAGNEGSVNDFLDNVFIAGTDITPSAWIPHSAGPRGWGLEVHRMEQGRYEGNILLDVRDQGASSWAINCVFNLTAGPEPIKVWNNIVRNWRTSGGASILVQSGAAAHFTLQNNIVDGINQTTGQPVAFVDGNRTLSTYLTSIGSSGDNVTFLENARAAWLGVPRSFPAAYHASAVNNYIRAGFEITSATPATGVSVLPASVAIETGATQQFTATVNPIGANQAVNWNSSNPSVASVDSSGLVTGVSPGTVAITATTLDGGFVATSSVTVSAPAPQGFTTIIFADSATHAYGNPGSLNTTTFRSGTASWQINYTSDTGTSNFNPLGTTATMAALTPYANAGYFEFYYQSTKSGTIRFQVKDPGASDVIIFDGNNGAPVTIPVVATTEWTRVQVPFTGWSQAPSATTVWRLQIRGWSGMSGATLLVDDIRFVAPAPSSVAVTGVSVAPSTASITAGETVQLAATVAPADATNQSVTWSSSNPAVATVNNAGLVTALAAGNATITVTTTDGGFTAMCGLTVLPESGGEALSFVTSVNLVDGNLRNDVDIWLGYQFTVGAAPITVTELGRWVVAGNANAHALKLVLASTGADVSGGSAQVATAGATAGEFKYAPLAAPVALEANTAYYIVSQEAEAGDQWYNDGVGISHTNAATIDHAIWRTEGGWNPGGTPDFGYGPLTFTYHAGSVGGVAVTGVSVAPTSASLPMGTTQQLAATVAPANASNRSVTWSSSNPAVATVNSSGLVTGVAAGNATITATTLDGGYFATSSVTVTAANVAVTGVSVSPTAANKRVGETQQLTATIAPANATNQTVSWSSSNPAVATVSSTGLVTAVAAGNATITVTTTDGGFTATSNLTITLAPVSQSYPLDANGWSIIAPSADSRLIYVSATGNDGTAQSYTMAQVGSDPANPSITVNAYQTLSTARSQMRVGYPDWLLFKRGDTFTAETNLGGNSVGGRSGSERWVFTNYGTSGNRPLLTGAYWSCIGTSGNMAIAGLEVYYRMRDPKSSFWVGFTSQNRKIFSAIGPITGNILLEDSIFRNAADNIVMDMDNGLNIELRRCAVWEGYKGTTTETGSAGANADRSQGIYVSGSSGLRIVDCFFDHNGWVQDSAGNLVGFGRSIYSHNIYLANGSNDTVVSGNLITRGAANGLQARSGNQVEDNLFVLNAIAMFSAAEPGAVEGDEGTINDVYDNVLIAGDDCLPSAWEGIAAGARAWGLEIHRMLEGHYEGNIILDVKDQGSASWAINCVFDLTSGTDTVKVWNNIVRNWHTTSGASILVESGAASHFDLQNNIVDGVNQTSNEAVTFVDGERTLSTYLTSIGSSGDNLAFLANARAAWLGAPRSYPGNYRATTVNNYIQEGFEIVSSTPLPGVSVSPASAELELGSTLQLTATVIPSEASQNVTWSSSNSSVATVSSSGLVTAVALGSAAITATAEAGGYTATCTVTVSPVGDLLVPFGHTAVVVDGQQDAAYGAVLGGISKPASSAEVPAASDISGTWRATYTATHLHVLVEVTDNAWTNSVVNDWENDGVEFFLDGNNSKGATPDNINDIKIAFVPRANGTVLIQTTVYPPNPPGLNFSGVQAAYTQRLDGEGSYQGYNLEIKVPLAVAGITPEEGWEFGIDFQINDNDDGGARDRFVTWYGTDLNNHPSVYGTAMLGSSEVVSVAGVSVLPTSTSLNVGVTQQLTATVAPANATNPTVNWNSNNPAVATVSASGLVTAISAGNAIVTVTTEDGGFTATSTITVEVPTIAVIGVSVAPENAVVLIGETQQLTATVTPANATNPSVTWSSDNPAVATVSSSGLVTAVATGSATITVETESGGFTAASEVTVPKLSATVTLGNTSQVYNGSPRPVCFTTSPEGLAVAVTYDGSSAAPTNAGTYTVTATVIDANFAGSVVGTLTITPATATIAVGDLRQAYDGTPRSVAVATDPEGLEVTTTYNGEASAPVYPGTYAVIATITGANHTGVANATLIVTTTALVRHAPVINGGVDGSVQQLLPEGTTLNGNAWISGDLLVPGTPTVRLNENSVYAGTKDGPGAAAPSNYQITLSRNALLRYTVRRIDAIAMPTVAVPPSPAGNTDVTLNSASQNVGNWATLRNLTLNGSAGKKAVPPGTYGTLTANGNTSLVLGVAGTTEPSIYNLQGLLLNRNSQLEVVGPIILTLAGGVDANGSMGNSQHPDWLVLQFASGGLTLNNNVTVHGHVVAPNGQVVINGNSSLVGEVVSDSLALSANGHLTQPASSLDEP